VIHEALLLLFLALGVMAQRIRGHDRIHARIWQGYFWTLTPILVFVTFLTVRIDAGLARALVAVIVASWAVVLLGWVYAQLASPERDERAALALAAAFGNTTFLGYPLASFAYGPTGLALAVVYDRLAFGAPALVASVTLARVFGRGAPRRPRRRLRALAANPPLLALLAAVSLRALEIHLPGAAATGRLAAQIVGPIGFSLLGLSIPLEPPAHGAPELARAAGALSIRFAGGPLALFLTGRAIGAAIPGVFYLLSAMPCAFHLLVLARVYDLRPPLMRLLVVGSTLPAVAVVFAVFRR
jgi:predicted permease